MAFKANESFLKFLTIGAVGTRASIDFLQSVGLRPIELERYCTSNKIWSTKVKRLRLPDLLCIKSGVRIEVRAKSMLQIKMSDAPANPERVWDAGLRDGDVIAFVACSDASGEWRAIATPTVFDVASLRSAVSNSRLGPPKAASEGSERDRTWPASVPKHSGVVLEVTDQKILAQMENGRKQSFPLKRRGSPDKVAYVSAGDQFTAGGTFLCGVVKHVTTPSDLLGPRWNPLPLLDSDDTIDRYVAAKAWPHVSEDPIPLEQRIEAQDDVRVALELAASAMMLGSDRGWRFVHETLWNGDREDLRMEAVFILTELGNERSSEELLRVARSTNFDGSELRQAAVWGLGKAGARLYAELVPYIADDDPAVAMHAISAFGPDLDMSVIELLIAELSNPDSRKAASASAVLRQVGGIDVARRLVSDILRSGTAGDWQIATLGALPEEVRQGLLSEELQRQVAPVALLTSETKNWLASSESARDLDFIVRQALPSLGART